MLLRSSGYQNCYLVFDVCFAKRLSSPRSYAHAPDQARTHAANNLTKPSICPALLQLEKSVQTVDAPRRLRSVNISRKAFLLLRRPLGRPGFLEHFLAVVKLHLPARRSLTGRYSPSLSTAALGQQFSQTLGR
jgi:hypothetical protein